MSDADAPVLLCRPVDLAPLMELVPDCPTDLIPKWYPGSIERPCAGCGRACYVGPRQQTYLGRPGIQVACMICAIVAGQLGMFRPKGVANLGNPDGESKL